MSALAKTQKQFMEAIYKRDASADALLDDARLSPKAQMEIYWRHTFNALSDVLAQHYPALEKIVGRKFLRSAAREFIATHPQREGNLEFYGAEFADFLRTFAPGKKLPYLPDVARLEWALHESEMAESRGALGLTDFAMTPENFMQLKLKFHPSVRLIESAFPIHDIWRLAMEGAEETIDLSKGGSWLMTLKAAGEAAVLPLRQAEFTLLKKLEGGATLFEAYEAASLEDPDFDLENGLKTHIVKGVFAR